SVAQELFSSLCLTALTSVDTELQVDIFNLLHEIVKDKMYPLHEHLDNLQTLYSCGLLTTLMIVHENDLYSSSSQIRLTTFEMSETIRHLTSNKNMDAQDL